MGALILALVLVVALLPAAGSFIAGVYQMGRGAIEGARHQALVARPPRLLPVRSEDFHRYPRSGFGLIYLDSNGNRLDTFAGTITKDLVNLTDTTIAVDLPPADLDSIHDAMIRIRFFDPDQLFPSLRLGSAIQPNTIHRLRARAGSAERELVWDSGTWVGGPTTDDGKRLLELFRLIWRRIEARPEYRTLPRPVGGYL